MVKQIREDKIMAQAQRVVREYVQRGYIENSLQATPTPAKRLRVAAYCRVSTVTDTYLQHGNAHYSI